MDVCLGLTFLHFQKHEREQKLVNSVTAEECFVYLTYTSICLFVQMIGLHLMNVPLHS